MQGNRSADTEAARSLPAAPEPREVRVSLARDGLGGVLRERYLGAWVRVQPPGQFLKSLIRIEIPSDQRDAFLCAVGSDYLGVCRPPPSREMRTYPLSQVQVILGAHCGKAGACATPPR